jgi:hypothetical protein
VSGNYFAGSSALRVVNCLTGLSVSGNTFYGTTSGFTPSSFPANTYLSARPTANQVFVRPNRYESGRAHVVVYNWQLLPSVSVDLSSVLAAGSPYEIRNAQDFLGSPVISGTYAGGSVSIPMTGLSVAAPVGATKPASTAPEFAAFVVRTVAAAPSCTYTLGASSATAAAGGASGSVAVTTGAGCAWTASSNAAWLTVTGGSGAGSGTVTWTAAPNTACTGRSGALTIGGRTFTVTQAAGTGAASLSPTAATTTSGAGGGSVSVTIGAGCAWTSSSNASWITVAGGGTGNGSATYTIASNSGCARAGSLTIAGQTFNVSQAANSTCSSGFYPVTPCRAIDTRNATSPLGGPKLSAGARRSFPVTASPCLIPPTAKSVSVTVTAVKPSADGILHAYPGNLAPTAASVLSFRKNRTRAATALLLLATDGTGTLGFQNESTGTVDIVVDVSGYFQ